jgi:hypothetical protein
MNMESTMPKAASDSIAPDDLDDVNPGLMPEAGWGMLPREARAAMILRSVVERMAGAAEALHAQRAFAEPSRASALAFVANTLRDQSKLMERALAVQQQTP